MQDYTLIDCCIVETLKCWDASQALCALSESEKQRIHQPLCEYLIQQAVRSCGTVGVTHRELVSFILAVLACLLVRRARIC